MFHLLSVFRCYCRLIARSSQISWLLTSGFVGDIPVFLAKPQTYMNLSGESVCDRETFFGFCLLKVRFLVVLELIDSFE